MPLSAHRRSAPRQSFMSPKSPCSALSAKPTQSASSRQRTMHDDSGHGIVTAKNLDTLCRSPGMRGTDLRAAPRDFAEGSRTNAMHAANGCHDGGYVEN